MEDKTTLDKYGAHVEKLLNGRRESFLQIYICGPFRLPLRNIFSEWLQIVHRCLKKTPKWKTIERFIFLRYFSGSFFFVKKQNLLLVIAWLLVGVATKRLNELWKKPPCNGSLYFQAVVSKCNFYIIFLLQVRP